MFKKMVVSFLLGVLVYASCTSIEKCRKKFSEKYVPVYAYKIHLDDGGTPKLFMVIFDDMETFWPMDLGITWEISTGKVAMTYYKDENGILWQIYKERGKKKKERIKHVVIGGEQVMW